ncbi:MAG: hypothetical protein ACI8QC_002733 [Planctomycetota bacterium]|jgi:hypothetical protein
MIAFLESKPFEMPIAVTSAAEEDVDEGTVEVSFAAGDLFLEHEDGQAYRLSWSADESEEGRGRVLPVGEYRLRTYRILAMAGEQPWHISVTKPTIKKVQVLEGEVTEIDIDPDIHLSTRVGRGMGMVNIAGEQRAGLTIYRGQQRIPMGYSLLDADGEQVAEGSMAYG